MTPSGRSWGRNARAAVAKPRLGISRRMRHDGLGLCLDCQLLQGPVEDLGARTRLLVAARLGDGPLPIASDAKQAGDVRVGMLNPIDQVLRPEFEVRGALELLRLEALLVEEKAGWRWRVCNSPVRCTTCWGSSSNV